MHGADMVPFTGKGLKEIVFGKNPLSQKIVSAGQFSILLTFELFRGNFDLIEFLEIAQLNSFPMTHTSFSKNT